MTEQVASNVGVVEDLVRLPNVDPLPGVPRQADVVWRCSISGSRVAVPPRRVLLRALPDLQAFVATEWLNSRSVGPSLIEI